MRSSSSSTAACHAPQSGCSERGCAQLLQAPRLRLGSRGSETAAAAPGSIPRPRGSRRRSRGSRPFSITRTRSCDRARNRGRAVAWRRCRRSPARRPRAAVAVRACSEPRQMVSRLVGDHHDGHCVGAGTGAQRLRESSLAASGGLARQAPVRLAPPAVGPRCVRRLRRLASLVRRGAAAAGQALGEDLVLVGQARDGEREVSAGSSRSARTRPRTAPTAGRRCRRRARAWSAAPSTRRARTASRRRAATGSRSARSGACGARARSTSSSRASSDARSRVRAGGSSLSSRRLLRRRRLERLLGLRSSGSRRNRPTNTASSTLTM